MSNSYLITGGEGFIGSAIIRKTGGTPYDLKSGLDILDTEKITAAMQGVSGVFHCAAKISVPESMAMPDEYYRNNVVGTQSVTDAAMSVGAKIVFSSSAAVYGETDSEVHEGSPLSPKSPYAQNKIDAENILKASKTPHIALRYFNAYGPGQSLQYAGVITAFILNALKGDDLVIYGNGTQVRDFIFIDDIVRANIMAMSYENSQYEMCNIGSGKETSIQELAETILRLTNASSKIVYKDPRPGDIVYSKANVAKAEALLGWKATVPLEEGLKETITYYKQAK